MLTLRNLVFLTMVAVGAVVFPPLALPLVGYIVLLVIRHHARHGGPRVRRETDAWARR